MQIFKFEFETLKNYFASVQRGSCLSEFCILLKTTEYKLTYAPKQLEIVRFIYAVVNQGVVRVFPVRKASGYAHHPWFEAFGLWRMFSVAFFRG